MFATSDLHTSLCLVSTKASHEPLLSCRSSLNCLKHSFDPGWSVGAGVVTCGDVLLAFEAGFKGLNQRETYQQEMANKMKSTLRSTHFALHGCRRHRQHTSWSIIRKSEIADCTPNKKSVSKWMITGKAISTYSNPKSSHSLQQTHPSYTRLPCTVRPFAQPCCSSNERKEAPDRVNTYSKRTSGCCWSLELYTCHGFSESSKPGSDSESDFPSDQPN